MVDGELPLAAAVRYASHENRGQGTTGSRVRDAQGDDSDNSSLDGDDFEAEGIRPEGRAGQRSDKWIARLSVPPEQFKFLVGRRGASKQDIER